MNNKEFNVRPNLFSALENFRANWKAGGLLWIDAICIDQAFTPEKNEQVQRMKDIYETSAGTIIWLGPADESTYSAFYKIHRISESWLQRIEALKSLAMPDELLEEYTNLLNADFGDADSFQLWDAVRALFNPNWWRRAWILQELCVTPSAVLTSTNCSIPQSKVPNVHLMTTQHAVSMPKVTNLDVSSFSKYLEMFRRSLRLLQDLELSWKYYRMSEDKSADLATMLFKLRRFSASDARGRVYAVLGLSEEGKHFRADYALSIRACFIQAVHHSIKSLRIMGHCKYLHLVEDLPSWAPGWINDTSYRVPLPQTGVSLGDIDRVVRVYSAGGKGGDGDVSIFPEEGLMVLDGVLLNEIIFVTNDLPKYAEKERVPQSFWFLNTVTQAQSTGHQIRTDCYHSVVHECKWLREWVESQQTTEIVYY